MQFFLRVLAELGNYHLDEALYHAVQVAVSIFRRLVELHVGKELARAAANELGGDDEGAFVYIFAQKTIRSTQSAT